MSALPLFALLPGAAGTRHTVKRHHNANGNVANLTNPSGVVVEKYKYDAFGKPTITDGSGNPLTASAYGNRFLFTGREYLAEVNLYDYRNRVYSADLGRFLQTDPLRFSAGDVNIYRYCENNPINATDAMGLCDDDDDDPSDDDNDGITPPPSTPPTNSPPFSDPNNPPPTNPPPSNGPQLPPPPAPSPIIPQPFPDAPPTPIPGEPPPNAPNPAPPLPPSPEPGTPTQQPPATFPIAPPIKF
jgi:RHS repeat-associated protein